MARDVTWDAVLRAARVLFGARAEVLLRGSAWRRELKRTYRRRALETHPDRARSLGRAEAELAREFQLLAEAYALLLEAPDPAPQPAAPVEPPPRRRERAPAAPPPSPRARERSPPPPPRKRERAPPPAPAAAPPPREPPRTARPRAKAKGAPRARAAGRPLFPPRRLRLGEYLFYSRRIPFEALIDAIAWQREQRPRIGRIAVDCGFLTPEQVIEILDRRRRDRALTVPFAEYAARIGLLSPGAQGAVVARQGSLQRRIGRYFVEEGWVTEKELAAAQAELAAHNRPHAER
jgi:hypothetical protein